MPKPGKAMLVMSNAMEEPVSVTLAGKTYKLGPLAGKTGPDGPLVEVSPGTHKDEPDDWQKAGHRGNHRRVKAGEIWADVWRRRDPAASALLSPRLIDYLQSTRLRAQRGLQRLSTSLLS